MLLIFKVSLPIKVMLTRWKSSEQWLHFLCTHNDHTTAKNNAYYHQKSFEGMKKYKVQHIEQIFYGYKNLFLKKFIKKRKIHVSHPKLGGNRNCVNKGYWDKLDNSLKHNLIKERRLSWTRREKLNSKT